MNTKIFIVFTVVILISDGDGIDWNRNVRDQPVNLMTDIINNLGVKLLNCYVEQPGNVAFSPTGLAFVLLTLYEGSVGPANRQISHVLELPSDRRITRIGTRDIYRRLRSYLNADAFLGGLTLNRDNIKLRPEYEDILRFYGFNVANGSVNGTLGDQSNSTTTENPSTALDNSVNSTDTSAPTTLAPEESSTAPAAPLQAPDTTTESTTTAPAPTTTPPPPPTTTVLTTSDDTATSQNLVESTPETTLPSESSTTTATPTTTDTSPSSIDVRMEDLSTIDSSTTPSDNPTTVPVANSSENNVRKKRSIRPRSFTHYSDPVWIDYPTEPDDEDDDIPESLGQQTTELNFLVHNCDVSTISTTTYTALLPFAYFPYLRAFGLEFPLDNPRYSVIVLVPAEGNDSRNLVRLLCTKTLRRLRNFMKPMWVKATIPSFTLRGFITLTPYIQKLGITDTFEPRSADLTLMSSDLGIYARDVQQSIGVNIRNYMKDSNDTLPSTTNSRNYPGSSGHSRDPIPFIADRPFLFFIVDTETSVALIAGRIDDPLNSRIN